jgi:hypothetical protein
MAMACDPKHVRLRRPLLALVALALCATALLAIVALVAGHFGSFEARVVLSTSALGVYGLLALPAGLLHERGHLRALAAADAALSAGALVVALFAIWGRLDEGPGPATWKTLLVLSLLAVATTQTAAVELRRRPDDPRTIRTLALVAAFAAYGDAVLGSLAGVIEISSGAFYRFLAAVAIVDGLMLVLVPLVRRAARSGAAVFRIAVRTESGRETERDVRARDFATAVAAAIRAVEAEGQRVIGVARR